MSLAQNTPGLMANNALKLARDERRRALSPREWKHRMAGLGYGIEQTTDGAVLTDLIAGRQLCALPSDLAV